MYQTIAYEDYVMDIRESQRARAKMLEPTGSFPRMTNDSVGYWKSVPSVRTPGRMGSTTSISQLLTTLYGNVHKNWAHDYEIHYIDDLEGILKEPK